MNKAIRIINILMLVILMSCGSDNKGIVFHQSHESSRQEAPYSDAVETDDFLFLTGQIGKNHKKGELVEGGIKAETKQVIENIQAVLQYHDLELDNVIKCTVILKDIKDFSAFNEVYIKYFTKKPALTSSIGKLVFVYSTFAFF